jgi:hypothetical protein
MTEMQAWPAANLLDCGSEDINLLSLLQSPPLETGHFPSSFNDMS